MMKRKIENTKDYLRGYRAGKKAAATEAVEKRRAYYAENMEALKAYQRAYYAENRETILAKAKEKRG